MAVLNSPFEVHDTAATLAYCIDDLSDKVTKMLAPDVDEE